MDRDTRNLGNKKQKRTSVKNGKPNLAELKDGIAEFRKTSDGMYQYLRHKNSIYKKKFDLASAPTRMYWTAPLGGIAGPAVTGLINDLNHYKQSNVSPAFMSTYWNDNMGTSPTTISSYFSRGFVFTAPKASVVTTIRGTVYNQYAVGDPFRFHVWKATPTVGTSDPITFIGKTDVLSTTTMNVTYLFTKTLTSNNILRAGERLYVSIKKESTSNNSRYFVGATLEGYYL
tara:strand:- start:223 stop:912 length:690 start_codon:yes stop_codon:yes gene_type:complete